MLQLTCKKRIHYQILHAWKNEQAVIVHSKSGIETIREAIGSGILTPIDNLYVRNNLPTMTDEAIGDKDMWSLSIEGVKNPRSFTLKQLKSMTPTTIAAVLQCSGNGRGFFAHGASGSQWKTGAAGCVMWTGVAVTDLVKMCGGLASGVKFLTGTGADMPKDQDPKKALMERSVPSKCIQRCSFSLGNKWRRFTKRSWSTFAFSNSRIFRCK